MPTSETPRAQRFVAYVDHLAAVLGHRDRHEPLRAYVTGLCLPGECKSIEPMAARVDPRHVPARHRSMHHLIAEAPWDAAPVLRVAREWAPAPMSVSVANDAEPTKYWLLTLPASMSLADLVRLAKLRWRIEREYQDLKDGLGLDHFEGRSWREFHHHGALCISAYAFLVAERARPSPRSFWPSSAPLAFPKLSRRGALPVRPERHVPHLDRHDLRTPGPRAASPAPCRACGRAPEAD